MKKINISKIIFIFIFIIFIILTLNNKVEARSYTIENMDFQVTAKDNEDLEKDIAKNIAKKENFTTILLIYWTILIFKYEADKKQYIDSKDDEMFKNIIH